MNDVEIFGIRGKAKPDPEAASRRRAWTEAVGRLCLNADFQLFVNTVLADCSLYARSENPRTEFGQGITATANRIRNMMLEAPEAVDLLARIDRIELVAYHKRLVAERDNKETENG